MAILFILIITLLLSLSLIYGFSSRGPWGSGWTVFLFLLLGIWAASFWLTPVGPVYYDVYWSPLLVIGIIFLFLLLATTPSYDKHIPVENEKEKLKYRSSSGGAMLFFWILMAIFIGLIIIGYTI